jgi:dephospho-CoA kinase
LIRVALTGGAGSGKSTAAVELARLGAPTLDTDDVSRDLLQEPEIRDAISVQFPEHVTSTGVIDRRQLRTRIALDPAAKLWLERLLHPRIWLRVESWLTRQHSPYCVVSVPLLVEAGWAPYFHVVILVEASQEVRVSRLQKRDGLSTQAAMQLISVQATDTKLRSIADFVLDNTRSDTRLLLENLRSLDAQLRNTGVKEQPGMSWRA